MTPDTIVRRNGAVLFARLHDEYLAIDSPAGYCYSLNAVSGRIWKMVEEPITVDALCARLRREYEVEEATCLRDVTELLTQLAQAGLVTLHAERAH